MAVLQNYPELLKNRALQIVITGGRPPAENFASYPAYILFDGNAGTKYSKSALAKIAMLSSSFRNYSKWNGTGIILKSEEALLKTEINKAHALHKLIRFWAAPDTEISWREFMHLKVDFINTDRINTLSSFLEKNSKANLP